MVSWADTVKVQIMGDVSKEERDRVVTAIGEVNRFAGRTLMKLVAQNGNIELRIAPPERFVELVPAFAKNFHSHFFVRSDNNGQITNGQIFVRGNISDAEKLRSLRMNLGRSTGLLYSSSKVKRSLFYQPGSTSYQFEEMDKAALRILAENADLRGKPLHQVRSALEAKYLGAKGP